MPRIGVNTLRWLLLVVNVGALAGLSYLGFDIAFGSDQQLRTTLPDPASVAVAEQAQDNIDAQVLNAVVMVHKAQPPRVAAPKPPPVRELPDAMQEGPLSDWEIVNLLASDGRRSATIEESVQQNVVNQVTQPTRGRAIRTRSARSRTTRQPTRRTAVPTTSRTKYLREGREFTIDGVDYVALRISMEPQEVEYALADGSQRRYILVGEDAEWTGFDEIDGGGILLTGLTDEELGLEPGANPAAGVPETSEDDRGSVRRGGADDSEQQQGQVPRRGATQGRSRSLQQQDNGKPPAKTGAVNATQRNAGRPTAGAQDSARVRGAANEAAKEKALEEMKQMRGQEGLSDEARQALDKASEELKRGEPN